MLKRCLRREKNGQVGRARVTMSSARTGVPVMTRTTRGPRTGRAGSIPSVLGLGRLNAWTLLFVSGRPYRRKAGHDERAWTPEDSRIRERQTQESADVTAVSTLRFE